MEARRMLPNDWTMGQLCYSIISLWLCSLASQDLFIARKQFSKGIIFQGPQKHSHNQYLSFDHFYGNIYNLLCLLKHADGIMQKKNTRSLAFEPRTWDPALVKIRSKKWRFEKTSANISLWFGNQLARSNKCSFSVAAYQYHCQTHPLRADNSCLFSYVNYHLCICTIESHFGLLSSLFLLHLLSN